MRNRLSTRFHPTSRVSMVISLLLIGSILSAIMVKPISGTGVSGAIWTTDSQGEQVNGNLYTDPKSVYLAGGPKNIEALGLEDGAYCFQVTDSQGKTLLSTDPISDRTFSVVNGYITESIHKYNVVDETVSPPRVVVQLWPFQRLPNTECKVWVTMNDSYSLGEGCFGFIPALSKTDNFKVLGVPKYFELWVTDGVYNLQNVAFYVNYTIDVNGTPVSPWIQRQLTYDRDETFHKVFRNETTFAVGTSIYWEFLILNTTTVLWTSDLQGPEQISEVGMLNKEIVFLISGHKYSYPDNVGIPGWTITLSRDNVEIQETQTDSNGYYEFIASVPGYYNVSCEGWSSNSLTWHEFEANGTDQTFDFYNYEILQMTNLRDEELQTFDVVFTSSKDGEGYKLSSTNRGSFFLKIVKLGRPGSFVNMTIFLPDDKANAEYDSPNFILHHVIRGSTSEVDLHVYKGNVEKNTAEITSSFTIVPSPDGKSVTISGYIPDDSDSVLVKVHIDYQISGSLSEEEVQSFNNFTYTFTVMLDQDPFGVHRRFGVHSKEIK